MIAGAPTSSAAGPVIPNFGHAESCVLENRTFCWGWVKAHWNDTLGPALVQHLELTAIAVGIGFALAFVLALVAHRRRDDHLGGPPNRQTDAGEYDSEPDSAHHPRHAGFAGEWTHGQKI